MSSVSRDFWKGKKVLITGHTGFKGTWLCEMLLMLGADVYGYALDPPREELSMFNIIDMKSKMTSYTGDIRDFDNLYKVFSDVKPEIVFHLAAQPLVRESYVNPRYTFETNIIGTVNILECIRMLNVTDSVVIVTTDKVYENKEWDWGYRETDVLNGFDPYSNSKSCSELVTSAYKNSFFKDIPVSTVRAGNVIGGGDFAKDRIIPDCVRCAAAGTTIEVRNPYSIRPYQHVLEPLSAYLLIAQTQYNNYSYHGNYNIGPDYCNCVTTQRIADEFCSAWKGAIWTNKSENGAVHEAGFLKLDCSVINQRLGWKTKWNITESIEKTVEWYQAYYSHQNTADIVNRQIKEYLTGTYESGLEL